MNMKIKFNTIEDIKNFCNDTSIISCDLFLSNGKYTVDAKSIMGIFSLDTSEALTFIMDSNSTEEDNIIYNKIIERYGE